MFEKKINNDYLKLSHFVYGGELYLNLKKYKLKEVFFNDSKIRKIPDSLLSKKGINDFYCYKNTDSGFSANLFENIKTNELVISFRGTERIGLGENTSDIAAAVKDTVTDVNLAIGTYDAQFDDAWQFYKAVKAQNPKRKIIIVGQSLGGALAQIIAAKEYTVNLKRIETYTYNAPGCAHLLGLYDCNMNYSYSFITNYSVMNDWCGMFGKHVGKRYLVLPIPLKENNSKSKIEILDNILFTSHEGIFEYTKEKNGKVISNPKEFGQREGMALWYFDPNNPIQNYKSVSDFLCFNISETDIQSTSIYQKTEQFIKDNIPEDIQNSNIAVAIKTATDNFIQVSNDSINNIKFNNIIGIAIKFMDSVLLELTLDDLKNAEKILKKFQKS